MPGSRPGRPTKSLVTGVEESPAALNVANCVAKLTDARGRGLVQIGPDTDEQIGLFKVDGSSVAEDDL